MNKEKKLFAYFEFTEDGFPTVIMLNADNEKAQAILEKSIDRLLKEKHCTWIKRLFKIDG